MAHEQYHVFFFSSREHFDKKLYRRINLFIKTKNRDKDLSSGPFITLTSLYSFFSHSYSSSSVDDRLQGFTELSWPTSPKQDFANFLVLAASFTVCTVAVWETDMDGTIRYRILDRSSEQKNRCYSKNQTSKKDVITFLPGNLPRQPR